MAKLQQAGNPFVVEIVGLCHGEPTAIWKQAARKAKAKAERDNTAFRACTLPDGGDPDGGAMLGLVTRWVDGTSLHGLLDFKDPPRAPPAPPTLATRLRICAELATGLASMHDDIADVYTHGDIKPENIIMESREPDARPIFIDFGFSKRRAGKSSDSLSMPQTAHNFKGTLFYCAPEMFPPDPVESSRTTDVFALGMVCWEMLTQPEPMAGGTSPVDQFRKWELASTREGKMAALKNLLGVTDAPAPAAEAPASVDEEVKCMLDWCRGDREKRCMLHRCLGDREKRPKAKEMAATLHKAWLQLVPDEKTFDVFICHPGGGPDAPPPPPTGGGGGGGGGGAPPPAPSGGGGGGGSPTFPSGGGGGGDPPPPSGGGVGVGGVSSERHGGGGAGGGADCEVLAAWVSRTLMSKGYRVLLQRKGEDLTRSFQRSRCVMALLPDGCACVELGIAAEKPARTSSYKLHLLLHQTPATAPLDLGAATDYKSPGPDGATLQQNEKAGELLRLLDDAKVKIQCASEETVTPGKPKLMDLELTENDELKRELAFYRSQFPESKFPDLKEAMLLRGALDDICKDDREKAAEVETRRKRNETDESILSKLDPVLLSAVKMSLQKPETEVQAEGGGGGGGGGGQSLLDMSELIGTPPSGPFQLGDHNGEWRNGRNDYPYTRFHCALDKESAEGGRKLCEHEKVIPAAHWSCCGATEKEAFCGNSPQHKALWSLLRVGYANGHTGEYRAVTMRPNPSRFNKHLAVPKKIQKYCCLSGESGAVLREKMCSHVS
jgi:hypothetical protein